ncbi:MAG TPA: dihydrofolate reductase family protein [Kineosporiaceae bacterium]|nr:dihydrofolate reductase family protein [Kineosporiaceae bacterium]
MTTADMTMVIGERSGPLSAGDLAAAYPWPDGRPWVRGMMVATLDGGSVGADGRSAPLSSPVDRLIMAEVRRYCDAVLIGASTFRAERYRPQRPAEEQSRDRVRRGLRPAPTLVLVSRSLDLPWEEAAFHESTCPPLVVTARSCDPAALEVARAHADVVVLPGERVRAASLLRLLDDRGLRRVVCEGGPHLLGELARSGCLDELDLALSPLMAGGGQIPLGEAAPEPGRYRLVQVITARDFLFTRYLRADAPPA